MTRLLMTNPTWQLGQPSLALRASELLSVLHGAKSTRPAPDRRGPRAFPQFFVPPPLWGRVGVGGRTPHTPTQPSPTRGEGAPQSPQMIFPPPRARSQYSPDPPPHTI